MAKVHITNVVVLDNPSSFLNPFQFELTFECIEELKEDLEWKMIYVGSAESEEYDQTLDTIYVGPVPEGRHIFVFQADPPDVTRIPGWYFTIAYHFIDINIFNFLSLFCRARCCRCDDCFVNLFLQRPRIRSRWLFHQQRLHRSRIEGKPAQQTAVRQIDAKHIGIEAACDPVQNQLGRFEQRWPKWCQHGWKLGIRRIFPKPSIGWEIWRGGRHGTGSRRWDSWTLGRSNKWEFQFVGNGLLI